MITAIVPAHNEAALIGSCLQSLQQAAGHPALAREEVRILVGLDRCTDGTEAVCMRFGVETVFVDAGNVGVARARLAEVAVAQGARWISCTDADTTVPHDWFVAQSACTADAFCDVVQVEDWEDFSPAVRRRFARSERARNGHRHVHGANMGFSAAVYLRSGGFQPLTCGEDVALIDAIERAGGNVARLGAPRVVTSARRQARTPNGFSHFLKCLETGVPDSSAAGGVLIPEWA
mgnify:CR=1 FL=1